MQLKQDNNLNTLKGTSKMAELNIISEKQNLLFKRKEIVATLDAEITPSKVDVEKLISEKFSTSPEKFILKYIRGKFGSKTFEIRFNIYETEEEKQSLEVKKKKRNNLKVTSKN